jgi:hypothetical protein
LGSGGGGSAPLFDPITSAHPVDLTVAASASGGLATISADLQQTSCRMGDVLHMWAIHHVDTWSIVAHNDLWRAKTSLVPAVPVGSAVQLLSIRRWFDTLSNQYQRVSHSSLGSVNVDVEGFSARTLIPVDGMSLIPVFGATNRWDRRIPSSIGTTMRLHPSIILLYLLERNVEGEATPLSFASLSDDRQLFMSVPGGSSRVRVTQFPDDIFENESVQSTLESSRVCTIRLEVANGGVWENAVQRTLVCIQSGTSPIACTVAERDLGDARTCAGGVCVRVWAWIDEDVGADAPLVDLLAMSPPNLRYEPNGLGAKAGFIHDFEMEDVVSLRAIPRPLLLAQPCVLFCDDQLHMFACLFYASSSSLTTVGASSTTRKLFSLWLVSSPSRSESQEDPNEDVSRSVPVLRVLENGSTDTGTDMNASLRWVRASSTCIVRDEPWSCASISHDWIDESGQPTRSMVVFRNQTFEQSPLVDDVYAIGRTGVLPWIQRTDSVRLQEWSYRTFSSLLTDMWTIQCSSIVDRVELVASSDREVTIPTGLRLSIPGAFTIGWHDVPLVRLTSTWVTPDAVCVGVEVEGHRPEPNARTNVAIRSAYSSDIAFDVELYCVIVRGNGSRTCQHARLDEPFVCAEERAGADDGTSSACMIEIGFRGTMNRTIEIRSASFPFEQPILNIVSISPPRAMCLPPYQRTILCDAWIPAELTPPIVVSLPWSVQFLNRSFQQIVVPTSRLCFLFGSSRSQARLVENDVRALPSSPGIVIDSQSETRMRRVETHVHDDQTFRVYVSGQLVRSGLSPRPFEVVWEVHRSAPAVHCVRAVRLFDDFIAGTYLAYSSDAARGGVVGERLTVGTIVPSGEMSRQYENISIRTVWLQRIPFLSQRTYLLYHSSFPSIRVTAAVDHVTYRCVRPSIERRPGQPLYAWVSGAVGSILSYARTARIRSALPAPVQIERQHGVIHAHRLVEGAQRDDVYLGLTTTHNRPFQHRTSAFGRARVLLFSPLERVLADFVSVASPTMAVEYAVPVECSSPFVSDDADVVDEPDVALVQIRAAASASTVVTRQPGQHVLVRAFGDVFRSVSGTPSVPTEHVFARNTKPRLV